MRYLILFLIAFIAVVTFFRTFDRVDAATINNVSQQTVAETGLTN